ncbi:MAG: VOC family protein [Gemmatirosa sp.]
MRVSGLLEAAVYGPDLDALERFYVDVLGLAPVARTPGRNVVLRCGAAAVILFDPSASSQPGGLFPPHGHRLDGGRIHVRQTRARIEDSLNDLPTCLQFRCWTPVNEWCHQPDALAGQLA